MRAGIKLISLGSLCQWLSAADIAGLLRALLIGVIG
jgi:hypothetical protein